MMLLDVFKSALRKLLKFCHHDPYYDFRKKIDKEVYKNELSVLIRMVAGH